MQIIKFKLTINRVRHIFTWNPETQRYVSDRDPDFSYRLESFFLKNNVEIYGIRSDNQDFIVDQTVIEDIGMIVSIGIDDEENIWFETEEGDCNIEDAVIEEQLANNHANTLEAIQADITRKYTRAIRLPQLLRARQETPRQFLAKFFKGTAEIEPWNETRNTIYVDDGSVQTESGKRRSFGDIYMILKYYYPNITVKEVIALLYRDLFTDLRAGMRSSNCGQIHKRVWYYDEDEGGQFMEAGQRDEYGNNKQFYLNTIAN